MPLLAGFSKEFSEASNPKPLAIDQPHVMTQPRQVLPNSTLLLTRRCTQGQFLLRPEPILNEAFMYCLAAGARQTGVLVHGFVVLSNHWHALVTDPQARVPEFLHLVHRNVALCVNELRDRRENVWSSAKPSIVTLETPADALRKLIYVLANPVASCLVEKGADWPGLTSAEMTVGSTRLVRRPKLFFSESGEMPAQAELHLSPLPGFSFSDHELTDAIGHQLSSREDVLAADREAAGVGVLGANACLRADPFATPDDFRDRSSGSVSLPQAAKKTIRSPTQERKAAGNINPRFAAIDKRARAAARERLASFLRRYHTARDTWRSGIKNVLFPAGTYWLRIHAGVSCQTGAPP